MPRGLSNWSFAPFKRQRSCKTTHVRHLPSVPETAALSAGYSFASSSYTAAAAAGGGTASTAAPSFSVDEVNNTTKETFGMLEIEKEEAKNLQTEFEWVLREEVHTILKQLRTILVECAHRFPVPLYDNEGKKTEKFILAVSDLKAIVTLTGDSITQADISFKLSKAPNQMQRTSITQDSPWKLLQVQDAANHLQQAINHIDDVGESYHFKTSDEVLHVIDNILEALQRGRTSLVIPKKKPIDELIKGRNMKSLAPNLSEDLAISFYLQSHKLTVAVYQLTNIQGTMRFDTRHAEASVEWLNEVLLMLTAGLKLCQQLKDKISVFSLYKDFTVGSRTTSALSY